MYILVFLLPWQTVLIIQEATIGSAGAVGVWQYGTLKVYIVEVLILFLAVVSLFCHLPAAKRNALWMFIMAFLIFAGLSIFWSEERLVALFAWVRLLEGAFLFYLFKNAPLRFSGFLAAWIFAAVIQSALGIWQFFTQDISASSLLGIAAHNPLELGTSVVEAGDHRWLRAYGGFPHPNIFGAYIAVSIIWCAVALYRSREKWQWIIILIASQIILIALLLTFSRSAWLAVIAAGLTCGTLLLHQSIRYVFVRKNMLGVTNINDSSKCISSDVGGNSLIKKSSIFVNPVAALMLLSIVTAGIFSAFFFEEVKTRSGFIESRLETKSASERIASFSRAVPLLRETWVAGAGIGNFTNALFRSEERNGIAQPWYAYQPLHNVFALVFAEAGIIGAVLFLFMIVTIFVKIRGSSAPVVGYSLLAAFFTFAIFDHFLWTLLFGIFMVGLVFGITSREQAIIEQIH